MKALSSANFLKLSEGGCVYTNGLTGGHLNKVQQSIYRKNHCVLTLKAN